MRKALALYEQRLGEQHPDRMKARKHYNLLLFPFVEFARFMITVLQAHRKFSFCAQMKPPIQP